MARQCEIIELNRSTLYYEAKPIRQYDLKIMRRIDEIYTDISSTYGYRFKRRQLLEENFPIGVNKVNRLMNRHRADINDDIDPVFVFEVNDSVE